MNILGGCQGSTGPSSIAPDGKAWGSRFPRITLLDQVRAEVWLMDRLGIDKVACVIGGSLGGARSLEWAIGFPRPAPLRTGTGDQRPCHRVRGRYANGAARRDQSPPGLAGW